MSSPENTKPTDQFHVGYLTHPDIILDDPKSITMLFGNQYEEVEEETVRVETVEATETHHDGAELILAENTKALAVLSAIECYDVHKDSQLLVDELDTLTKNYRYILGKRNTLANLKNNVKIAFPKKKTQKKLPPEKQAEFDDITTKKKELEEKRRSIINAALEAENITDPAAQHELLQLAFNNGASEISFLYDYKGDMLVEMSNVTLKKGIKLSQFALLKTTKITRSSSIDELSPFLDEGFDEFDERDYRNYYLQAKEAETRAKDLVCILKDAKAVLDLPIDAIHSRDYVKHIGTISAYLEKTLVVRIDREIASLAVQAAEYNAYTTSQDRSQSNDETKKAAEERVHTHIEAIRSQVQTLLRSRGYNLN